MVEALNKFSIFFFHALLHFAELIQKILKSKRKMSSCLLAGNWEEILLRPVQQTTEISLKGA